MLQMMLKQFIFIFFDKSEYAVLVMYIFILYVAIF